MVLHLLKYVMVQKCITPKGDENTICLAIPAPIMPVKKRITPKGDENRKNALSSMHS